MSETITRGYIFYNNHKLDLCEDNYPIMRRIKILCHFFVGLNGIDKSFLVICDKTCLFEITEVPNIV